MIKEGERIDDLQLNGLKIIQSPGRFCFGMDSSLLSGFVKVRENETVLDLGTGTGILPILLSEKTRACHLTGLEIQKESADMARRSVALNHLEERIDIVEGDIKEADRLFRAESIDVLVTNPPYMIADHGIKSRGDAMCIARHEVLVSLDDILRVSRRILPFKGRFYMVHRPFRLAEILTKMHDAGIEPKCMRLVYPKVDREPNMVLIEGVKGAKSRMTVMPPLIVYNPDGSYTEEVLRLYSFREEK